ncbi:DNA polymerase III subunit delta, partial [Candidatus Aerophobetes bacterium]|nr:DNA polymerase III subunit delta [Candidatus Aerophobetes bacterium]
MRYSEFLANLRSGKVSHFYLFVGEEDYLKKEALEKLKAKLIPEQTDFNFQPLTAPSHTGRDIVEAASQLPFNSRWSLVVVEEMDKLNAKDERMLINYLERPVESTCMVFIAGEFNFKSKLHIFFKKKNKIVFFHPLDEVELLSRIKDKAKKEGKTITHEAAWELHKRVGKNLFVLYGEIDKLVSFSHPENSIDKLHVVQLCGETVEGNIFDFLQAFRENNLSVALRILSRLFSQGEEPLKTCFMLTREIRILFSLKLAGPKLTAQQACPYIFKGRFSYTGFYLKKAKDYLGAAKNFSISQLLFAQERILNTEFSIKRGKERPDLALQ